MSIFNRIFGRPLASSSSAKQQLSVLTGVPALGLDALASIAYGPEAALGILLPLGVGGLYYFPYIMLTVVIILVILYSSYLQTTAAYPNGGGAYIVASDNLGKNVGVWAAVALLIDYLLNVSVGISAGIGAMVSAIPALHAHKLSLCLLVLATLTIINLRGLRESGLFFIAPLTAFVLCLGIAAGVGVFDTLQTGGHPQPIDVAPLLPEATTNFSVWLLLGALANGLTAMTGIEAISNAVPMFRKPMVRNAQLTLTIIVILLALFLLLLGYLCPVYHVIAMDETLPGYQTILSQIVAATMGKGVFYYFAILSIFTILTYSAQTSFAGFPRVCRLLAEDDYLPHFFADLGRRLVFAHGIVILSVLSAVLLIVFDGITNALIPLFAVGAFSAFLFSQSGMVIHWLRRKQEPYAHIKLFFNALGAITTAIALGIIISAKFLEGAWIVVVVAPLLVLLMYKINRHYKSISRQVVKPIDLKTTAVLQPIVIIPIQNWDRIAQRAVQFGLTLAKEVLCVHISTTPNDDENELRKIWAEKVVKPATKAKCSCPQLNIIYSPYRRVNKPILDFVKKIRSLNPESVIIVVIPELVEPHWYENLMHNIHAAMLRTMLFLERDSRTLVITIPWYLRDK